MTICNKNTKPLQLIKTDFRLKILVLNKIRIVNKFGEFIKPNPNLF